MLSISLFLQLVSIPLYSYLINSSLFNRISFAILFYSATFSFTSDSYFDTIANGITLYSDLFQVSSISLTMETFLLIIGSILLLSWAPINSNEFTTTKIPTIFEYSVLVIITTIGSCLLLSSFDLISMFLSIELQSFGVYILSTLYRNSESATSAGLKYFLLGGLSSCLLLLGSCIIYSYTGLTQFSDIYTLTLSLDNSYINTSSDPQFNYINDIINLPIQLGLVLIGVGFMFKVAAAPFHNWAPDVYDGVPTIVTSWLTNMPKIALFIFLLQLQIGVQGGENLTTSIINIETELNPSINIINNDYSNINIWKNLLIIASLLSLIIGTIVGLSQDRIKRLLAYSTISHVGFILLSLSIISQESIESFIFYIIQYSITNVNTFLIILAFQYIIWNDNKVKNSYQSNNKTINSINITDESIINITGGAPAVINIRPTKPIDRAIINEDISLITELRGQFITNPILSISLAFCLFSMAGIPPLIGFFAKQMVLYTSIHNGYYFISIIAILVSVISASYYLKIVKILYFSSEKKEENNGITTKIESDNYNENNNIIITNIHTTIISILSIIIVFFVIQPSLLLNICEIVSLSLFNY